MGEIAEHEERFRFRLALVGEEIVVFRREQGKFALLKHRIFFPQRGQPAVAFEDRARAPDLLGGVDLMIILVYGQPRRPGREARVWGCIPLHRRARVVAAAPVGRAEDLRVGIALRAARADHVERLHVLIIVQRKAPVRHAELLPLVDIGRALHAEEQHGEHFGRRLAIFPLVAPAGDDARNVVVFPEETVPAAAVQPRLPALEDLLELI